MVGYAQHSLYALPSLSADPTVFWRKAGCHCNHRRQCQAVMLNAGELHCNTTNKTIATKGRRWLGAAGTTS